jgi:hypothetical protein
MFRWYKRSKVCYAHLSDVQDEGTGNPWKRKGRFRSNFCNTCKTYSTYTTHGCVECGRLQHELEEYFDLLSGCRWFQRGWTLQELVAPRRVIFYSRNWYRIGPEQRLMRLVSEITGMDNSILNHEIPLSDLSIAERMSWAAKRRTTRIEDVAYCMLGIFKVNMPLLYGEGDRAFLRLQEEIMKVSEDQSLFAWGLDKEISPMNLRVPHPGRPSYFGSPRAVVAGFFAKSPKDFESGDMIQSFIELRYDEHYLREGLSTISTRDFPLPGMLMNNGLRIDLPTLCQQDLALSATNAIKGKQLCKLAHSENLVVFAVLNCGLKNASATRIAISLLAWDFENFGRFSQPVWLDTSEYMEHIEERGKIIFIKEMPVRDRIK